MLFQHNATALPVSLKSAIRRIDHVTYVTAAENESAFIASWQALGFQELNRLHTERYPAAHIVLAAEPTAADAWTTMTGLSVSPDPKSPINEFVRRYGTGVQHVAYAIHTDVDMEAMYELMQASGWRFITPLLDYTDANEARLRQTFVAPTLPYGPFVEFVQRLPGKNGQVFENFEVDNIDDLYAGYDAYSQRLLKQSRPNAWSPAVNPAVAAAPPALWQQFADAPPRDHRRI